MTSLRGIAESGCRRCCQEPDASKSGLRRARVDIANLVVAAGHRHLSSFDAVASSVSTNSTYARNVHRMLTLAV
jgi:hypothetical protein